MDTAITLPFADGAYEFDLGLAQINEIQDKCGAGIGAVYARLMKGRYVVGDRPVGNPLEAEYYLADIVETLRQGLIGGGKGQVDGQDVTVTAYRANQLIDRYVLAPGRPIEESWMVAAAVMGARMIGFDPPEKESAPKQAKKKAPRSGRAGSITPEPSSTAQ